MNPLYGQLQQSLNPNNLIQQINQLKQRFNGDPNQFIQQMLNSGKVTQEQYNAAVQRAQSIMQMMQK